MSAGEPNAQFFSSGCRSTTRSPKNVMGAMSSSGVAVIRAGRKPSPLNRKMMRSSPPR
jgi:hypothetical protein